MTTQQIHETHIKIAFFAVLVIMLAAIYVAIPDFYRTVWQLSTSGNMQGPGKSPTAPRLTATPSTSTTRAPWTA